jgi:REP element-mobilizing transposase RayT
MPRKLRVESCGYHHVYNRGVAKGIIFVDSIDKEKFLEILGNICKDYKFNIHSFCLMNNHYHLLVENQRENLSDGMRQINSQYASYFNKRHNRVGHLWQDRFKSSFVYDENYLFTLFKYIEQNPLKANLSKRVGEYKYSATYSILRDAVPRFLQNTFVLREYQTKELFEALEFPLSKTELSNIEKLEKTKYKVVESNQVMIKQISLNKLFDYEQTREERNENIKKAYEDGYTKSEIARKIGFSVAGVSKILKKLKV